MKIIFEGNNKMTIESEGITTSQLRWVIDSLTDEWERRVAEERGLIQGTCADPMAFIAFEELKATGWTPRG